MRCTDPRRPGSTDPRRNHRPRGTERLRITPTPFHSDALIDGLRDALIETWDSLGIPYGTAGQPVPVKSDRIVPLLVPQSGG